MLFVISVFAGGGLRKKMTNFHFAVRKKRDVDQFADFTIGIHANPDISISLEHCDA